MPEKRGAELIAESMNRHDVDYFFNIPGIGLYPLVEAVHNSGIDIISGLNETVVGLMAEGYSRATREPTFLNVYHSSGTALALMAVTIAWADRSPLILTSTTSSRMMSGQDQYAAVPKSITDITDQYTKWGMEVPLLHRIPDVIDRAVTIAKTPPMGPVHLAFPMDLYHETINEEDLIKKSSQLENKYPSSPRSEPYIDSRLGKMEMHSNFPADQDGLRKTSELLSGADQPVIAAGGEVGQYYANAELTQLSEALNAPVITEIRTSTYLPMSTKHPLYRGEITEHLGSKKSSLIENSDVILFVGFELSEGGFDQYPFKDTDKKLIQLSINPDDIGKQFTPDIGLIGHPKASLDQIHQLVDSNDQPTSAIDVGVNEENKIGKSVVDTSYVGEFFARLESVFGDELVLVNVAGSVAEHVKNISLESPDSYYRISGKGSAQGWGVPAGIGIQLGLPDNRVVVVDGDGGFMFTGPNALYTAARLNIPVTFVIGNNGGWGGGDYKSKIENGWQGDYFLGDMTNPPIDFTNLVKSLGIHSVRVSDKDDINEALAESYESEGPSFIELVLNE